MTLMRKKNLARLKKSLVSLIVLAIFLFPAAVSARWVYEIVDSRDKRPVFSEAKIASFHNEQCEEQEPPEPFEEPLITITFDDGWESVYTNAFEVLEAHCIDTTQYILGDEFNEQNYLSIKQVHSLQDAGHEIASHTMTHPNLVTLGNGDLDWELNQSHSTLSKEFGQVRDFASPLGSTNDEVIDKIKSIYRSHRNTIADPAEVDDTDINTKENFNIYQINAYTIRNDTTDDDLRRPIDYTIEHNGWLILTYHQVDDSNEHYSVNKETLARHMALVNSYYLKTPTMGTVLDAIAAGRGSN